MPPVPGRGSGLVDLRLLMLGQHIAVNDAGAFDSVQAVVKALGDVLSLQHGRASVTLRRNQHLIENTPASSAFRLSTPAVTFADPVVPLLRHPRYDLAGTPPSDAAQLLSAPDPSALETRLAAFFASLFSSGTRQRARPVRDATAELTFTLEVFSGGRTREAMPLVTIDDLHLAAQLLPR